MLYGEFIKSGLECEDCPLNDGECCPGGYTSNGRGEPIEPPCCMFDDDTDMEEWLDGYYERQSRREDAEDRRMRAQKEKEAKNKITQERRRRSKLHVLSETQEIKRLQKRIAANNSAMRLADSLAFAFNATNEMFGYSERYNAEKAMRPAEIENKELQQRIDELSAIKKQKLKEFRKQYINA